MKNVFFDGEVGEVEFEVGSNLIRSDLIVGLRGVRC